MICLLEGWIRQKTRIKCKQMYFIPGTLQLIFRGLNISNKYWFTFTFMYLWRQKNTTILAYKSRNFRHFLGFIYLIRSIHGSQNMVTKFRSNNIFGHSNHIGTHIKQNIFFSILVIISKYFSNSTSYMRVHTVLIVWNA